MVILEALFILKVSAPMREQLLFKTFPASLGRGGVGSVSRGMRQTCHLSKPDPALDV